MPPTRNPATLAQPAVIPFNLTPWLEPTIRKGKLLPPGSWNAERRAVLDLQTGAYWVTLKAETFSPVAPIRKLIETSLTDGPDAAAARSALADNDNSQSLAIDHVSYDLLTEAARLAIKDPIAGLRSYRAKAAARLAELEDKRVNSDTEHLRALFLMINLIFCDAHGLAHNALLTKWQRKLRRKFAAAVTDAMTEYLAENGEEIHFPAHFRHSERLNDFLTPSS